jgi:DMSO/TMAO reductase YedYZ heme-binding membrane subunit
MQLIPVAPAKKPSLFARRNYKEKPMVFLVSLVAVTVFVLALRVPIKKAPWLFYLLALALVGYYVYEYFYGTNVLVWRYLLVSVQRGSLALAFLMIVMFIGVLSDASKLRLYLYPIRQELSIIGCILVFGHIIVYANSYIMRFLSGFAATSLNIAASLVIALALVILLVILLVTSFTFVRKQMGPKRWKSVQRLAYPFFLVIYLHLLLLLLPSALAGTPSMILNISLYTILFAAYSILRLRKFFLDRQKNTAA